MAKLSFLFRHVSPVYYEVRPLYFANGESNPSKILTSEFLSAVDAYTADSLVFGNIAIDLLQTLPFADDLFFIGSGNISRFIQSLASIPSTSGFDNFTFLDLDGNSFVIELSIDKSISHYFTFDDTIYEPKEQKKAA